MKINEFKENNEAKKEVMEQSVIQQIKRCLFRHIKTGLL